MVGRAVAAPLAALLLALAACGEDGRPSDSERLQSYVALLQARQFALEAGDAAGYPGAARCAERTRALAATLARELEEMGVAKPLPPESVQEVEGVLDGLSEVDGPAAFARYASEFEAVATAAWPLTGAPAPVQCPRAGASGPQAAIP